MLDLSREVLWWEEWQLRILVLASLFLQFVLFVGSMVRHVPSLKSCMWLAYIGADAVAIYALSTLFNRHKVPAGGGGGDGSSNALEVLWAPVLLVHLGGHHTYTAYSLEDNELWGRHLMTLVSQVTVALYVFCKSWPGSGGDRRLLQVAVLMFVAGILKFAMKPWALRAASLRNLTTSSSVYPQRRAQRRGGLHHKILDVLLTPLVTVSSSMDAERMRREEEQDISLERYVEKARKLQKRTKVVHEPAEILKDFNSRDEEKLFVDLSLPYSRRLKFLATMLKLDDDGLHGAVMQQLNYSFQLIYTNFKATASIPGILLKLLLPCLFLASAVLFSSSRKDRYRKNDITVTYILLWCTTSLGFLSLLHCYCFVGAIIWPYLVSQHNLMSFCARSSKPTWLMKLTAIVGCKDYINMHWYVEQVPASPEIVKLVARHVRDGWRQYIDNGASYKRFNNLRGQRALRRHKQARDDPRLLSSLHLPFDQSVLVWHVATELCLHHPTVSSSSPPAAVQESPARRSSRVMSNYMIYLLAIRPEMLMPGARQGLFTHTSDCMELFLKSGDEPAAGARSVARRILAAESTTRLQGTWVRKARELADALMELRLRDEETRWKLIRGVWVEMLCYSAGRCRGYLHAKTMGEGVEFLTTVWLLCSRMGMETFADKFQRPRFPSASSASKPQDERPVEEEIGITVE